MQNDAVKAVSGAGKAAGLTISGKTGGGRGMGQKKSKEMVLR